MNAANLAVLLCLCALPLRANELPEPVLPEGVGVNIHFVTGHERDLDLIAAAGFKWIRMDFAWESIEHKRGEYDWSAYDELTRNLASHGLKAIYILDYSNPIYEQAVESRNGQHTDVVQRDTASPQHPESIAAFARWAAAAARHFHGKHIIWEIWNEPNGYFWKPGPNAKQYTALALATARAIREAAPDATIVGPALATFQMQFMETFLKSGILKYINAVSVHPYRDFHQPPETVKEDYKKLDAMIRRYADEQKTTLVPIISGEWGYTSKDGGISPENQAAFLVRQQLFNLLSGVPLSIWYDWQNDGPDRNEGENNFGTVNEDLSPKPAYQAISVMARELAGYRIVKTASDTSPDFILTLQNAAGHKKLAVWTTSKPHTLSTVSTGETVRKATGVDGRGKNFAPEIWDGRLQIELDSLPKYVDLN